VNIFNTRKSTRAHVRPLPQTDINNIMLAIHDLKMTRDRLRFAGADKAANYVARALKSTEGALRHAQNKLNRQERKRNPFPFDGNPRDPEVQS
jgi:hypothetical protein